MDRCDAAPLVFQAGRYAVASPKSAQQAFSQEQQDDDASFSENFTGYLLARAHFQFYSQLRGHMEQHGLSDNEYFVLSVLLVRDGRSIDNFNERFSYTGHQATPQLIARLEVKGLLQARGPAGEQLCYLTEQGRATTLRIVAAAKGLEADMMGRLGEWDAAALKNLLKQFILHTDPGLAHPWSA
jgi:3-hydroxy-9,10-secoandrosta-1,3,5(10)-triene-9,17-dione monooxygenase reductase component